MRRYSTTVKVRTKNVRSTKSTPCDVARAATLIFRRPHSGRLNFALSYLNTRDAFSTHVIDEVKLPRQSDGLAAGFTALQRGAETPLPYYLSGSGMKPQNGAPSAPIW